MSVVVQDNFLDKEYFEGLQDEIIGELNHFPWRFSVITFDSVGYQMCHPVYEHGNGCSKIYNKLIPFFEKLDAYCLTRVKINLLKREEKIIEHGMHIDIAYAPENALTSILYINTNNGYTKFENGDKVESVENRLVTFPNSLRHAGSTNNCDAMYRCVMNIDWIKRNK